MSPAPPHRRLQWWPPLALMESPAIIVGLLLVKLLRRRARAAIQGRGAGEGKRAWRRFHMAQPAA